MNKSVFQKTNYYSLCESLHQGMGVNNCYVTTVTERNEKSIKSSSTYGPHDQEPAHHYLQRRAKSLVLCATTARRGFFFFIPQTKSPRQSCDFLKQATEPKATNTRSLSQSSQSIINQRVKQSPIIVWKIYEYRKIISMYDLYLKTKKNEL